MNEPFPINHDLHNHTFLSACCYDEQLTAAYTCGFAKKNGYSMVCFTDHFWDSNAPGAIDWYKPQNLGHVEKLLPLPEVEGLRVMFGCETEFCGKNKIGITPESYGKFDMIVVPVNHFHMEGFVRPESCDTEEKVAELLASRLEELLELGLPWKKTGIAHLNGCIYMEGERYSRALTMIPDARLRAIFSRLAKNGAGVELNAGCFKPGWADDKNAGLRIFRTALEENCKFYCGSDAHACGDLSIVSKYLRDAADLIGLTAGDLFVPE